MGVEVIDAVTGAVDKRAAIFMTLVGGAPCDGIRSGELTVNMVVRRCACEKVDLERFPFSWRALALSANATVTTLGVPDAVKPDVATVSPFLMIAAASSAVINGILICNV